jgi:hypothetical protein
MAMMAIEIVRFPINSMVIFHSYVSLPERICNYGEKKNSVDGNISNTMILSSQLILPPSEISPVTRNISRSKPKPR